MENIKYIGAARRVNDYINKLKYAKEIARAIMDIFESGVHKGFYEKLHKEV